MSGDRAALRELTETCEALIAGTGPHDVLDRLRRAVTRARIVLDHCPPDEAVASCAAYAAGRAAQAGAHP